jgi:hypothetical protein
MAAIASSVKFATQACDKFWWPALHPMRQTRMTVVIDRGGAGGLPKPELRQFGLAWSRK